MFASNSTYILYNTAAVIHTRLLCLYTLGANLTLVGIACNCFTMITPV